MCSRGQNRKALVSKQLLEDWFNNCYVHEVYPYLTSNNVTFKVLVLDNAPWLVYHVCLTNQICKLHICPRTPTHSLATQCVNNCDIEELLPLTHLRYLGSEETFVCRLMLETVQHNSLHSKYNVMLPQAEVHNSERLLESLV
jgi:hypothetical protein